MLTDGGRQDQPRRRASAVPGRPGLDRGRRGQERGHDRIRRSPACRRSCRASPRQPATPSRTRARALGRRPVGGRSHARPPTPPARVTTLRANVSDLRCSHGRTSIVVGAIDSHAVHVPGPVPRAAAGVRAHPGRLRDLRVAGRHAGRDRTRSAWRTTGPCSTTSASGRRVGHVATVHGDLDPDHGGRLAVLRVAAARADRPVQRRHAAGLLPARRGHRLGGGAAVVLHALPGAQPVRPDAAAHGLAHRQRHVLAGAPSVHLRRRRLHDRRRFSGS